MTKKNTKGARTPIMESEMLDTPNPSPTPSAEETIVAGQKLRQFVARIERLEEDKAAVTEDIKEVYSEAKSEGFDAAILREVVKLRGMDPAKRSEREAILELYLDALDGRAP